MSMCVTELKAPLSVPISGVSVVHPYTTAHCACLHIEENRDTSENYIYVNSELYIMTGFVIKVVENNFF